MECDVQLTSDLRSGARPYIRAVGQTAALATVCLSFPQPAWAHVKWFCNFDVASQPRVLDKVVSADFVALTVLAIAVMLAGCLLDRTKLGEAISRALDRVTMVVRANADVLIRATCGFFLIALWTMGGILLTPELKTASSWVPQLQLAMAAALLTRRTTALTGLGIVILYGLALRDYGLFHLMDYPIFLGVAAYLVATSWPVSRWIPLRPLDLLRWSASVTLMWASVEKWAYPDWTLPLYIGHPAMSMGYDFELFMRAAGVIEFTLAFALLLTPLVRRTAAFILIGMFVSATAEFGKIDAIGHSVIIAVLLLLAADETRAKVSARQWRWVAEPALAYAVALLVAVSLYYGVHAWLFGTGII
jgi:hypothetical protein